MPRSLAVAGALHWLMLAALAGFGWLAAMGRVYFGSLVLVAVALVFEQRSARSLDPAGINRAFFQSNAFVSAVFVAAVILDVYVRTR